jgi:hypothetical protein
VILSALLGAALATTEMPLGRCNYAKVVGGRQGITVYKAHSVGSPRVARLRRGTTVYVCDEFRREDGSDRWVEVRFKNARHPCFAKSEGIEMGKARFCQAGWTQENYIEVLSG